MEEIVSFLDLITEYPQADVLQAINKSTSGQIDHILAQPRISIEDFARLLNPQMSDVQLEQMASRAQQITRQRFGRTILLYAPLYLSNECLNSCLYCGFNADNELRRKTLTLEEVERETRYLHTQGFRHLLLLTGEAPDIADVDYLERVVNIVKPYCGSISIEVFPMSTDDYGRMVSAGVDGLTLYQETYDPDLYRSLHPYGPKSDYAYRLQAPERAGEAGMRRIGIGSLLGLGNPLTDVFYSGLHARFLMKRFWKTLVTLSFPRLRPAPGGFTPQHKVSDRQLTQFICALRLLLPDAGLVLSTRESASLRDNLLPLGITQMSAGSCTAPGGYGDHSDEGGQFSINDDRSPAEIEQLLRASGYDPVWKDWDAAFLTLVD